MDNKFTDKVEKWWNNLSKNQKREFVDKTFGHEWYEDNTLVYADIETIYKKFATY